MDAGRAVLPDMTDAGFVMPPKITKVAKKPNIQRDAFVFLKNPFLKSIQDL